MAGNPKGPFPFSSYKPLRTQLEGVFLMRVETLAEASDGDASWLVQQWQTLRDEWQTLRRESFSSEWHQSPVPAEPQPGYDLRRFSTEATGMAIGSMLGSHVEPRYGWVIGGVAGWFGAKYLWRNRADD